MKIKAPTIEWLDAPIVTLYPPGYKTWHCESCDTYTDDPHWCDCVRYGNPKDKRLTRMGWRRVIRRSDVLAVGLAAIVAAWIAF
jgi:hypothetical protein